MFKNFVTYVSDLSFLQVLLLGLFILILWASFFEVDQTITTHGQVISEEKTQIIQAVDGGVLTDLKVREGQAVKAGEVLAMLQTDSAESGYESALVEVEANKTILASIKEELTLSENLYKTGDIGYLEVARLKRQYLEMQARVMMGGKKVDQQKLFLSRTTLTSPVNGSIKLLKITTIGGVLRPGEEIMEISPELKSLVIEVKINPADIGALKAGLPATIKFDAFDYAIFGSLRGIVGYISQDSMVEQGPGGVTTSFYRAHIDVPVGQSLEFERQQADFKLGMSATVDIKTGSRTVLRYLLKPIYKGFDGALHQK
jgi:membrane fusion protein, adhesin transport system